MSVSGLDESTRYVGLTHVRRMAENLAAWLVALFDPARLRRRPAWTSPLRLAGGAAVAVALVALAMLYLDASAIAHQEQLPRWVVLTFEEITDFGRSGWLLWPIGVVLLLLGAITSPAAGRLNYLVLQALAARVGFVFVAVGLPGLLVTVVKRVVGRARPISSDPGAPFTYHPFNFDVAFASLPSGHGTTAFATAFALGALYPRARVPLWIFAVTIAVSRVAIAVHFPSDVIAGAVIGTFGALVVRNWFASRRLAFAVAPDGSTHALPGPSLRRAGRAIRRAFR
jgi:undecaprenyl-diphosphatase